MNCSTKFKSQSRVEFWNVNDKHPMIWILVYETLWLNVSPWLVFTKIEVSFTIHQQLVAVAGILHCITCYWHCDTVMLRHAMGDIVTWAVLSKSEKSRMGHVLIFYCERVINNPVVKQWLIIIRCQTRRNPRTTLSLSVTRWTLLQLYRWYVLHLLEEARLVTLVNQSRGWPVGEDELPWITALLVKVSNKHILSWVVGGVCWAMLYDVCDPSVKY